MCCAGMGMEEPTQTGPEKRVNGGMRDQMWGTNCMVQKEISTKRCKNQILGKVGAVEGDWIETVSNLIQGGDPTSHQENCMHACKAVKSLVADAHFGWNNN